MRTIFLIVFCILMVGSWSPSTTCHQEVVITNAQYGDGFGSQFHTIIATVLAAHAYNLRYAYTPFTSMDHNYHNDPHFLEKKEWLINFIGNVEPITHFLTNPAKYRIISVNAKQLLDNNASAYAQSPALQRVKDFFRANKNRIRYFDPQRYHIAIHIRRHNAHDNRINGTNVPDHTFLHIINRLRSIYAAKNPLIHIYSQGTIEQFAQFRKHDVILHLNESVEDTFSALVFADVLVTSPSCFSYAAALLSNGIVYALPFWHTSLPHWISTNTL